MEESWGDVVARIFITASLIACAIPTLFFIIVSEAEANIVVGTMKAYIRERCALLRPWIPARYSSSQLMDAVGAVSAMGSHRAIEDRNQTLRLLAFQAGILVLAVCASFGLAIWYFYGTSDITDIMGRTFFYTVLFCVTELVFVIIITRMPLLDKRRFDMILLDRIIHQGRECK
jgi:hypothetical protein